MEIAPLVYHLPTSRVIFPGLSGPNVYLIAGQLATLFDSGLDDPDLVAADLKYVQGLGICPSYVILSHHHPDHAGGVALIKERIGATIVAHPLEADKLSNLVDISAEDGHRLRLGGQEIELIHTPGHSPGHLCAYLPRHKLLFSGDHILGLGTTVIAPPMGDIAQYIASLRRLLDYDIQMICPGHGLPIRAARRKIEELIEHRLERERQVLDLLNRGMWNVDQLVKEIYPELDRHLAFLAKAQIKAHLLKLKREGKVPSH